MNDLSSLERAISYHFRQPHVLLSAITHPSFTNEVPDTVEHNERLEFLGDAVIGAVVSLMLYEQYPAMREGDLTRMKSALVNEAALAEQARRLGLGPFLRLGRGVVNGGSEPPPSMLCGAFEALVGAIFLDGGFDAARAFVSERFGAGIASAAQDLACLDPKSALQMACLKQSRTLPVYTVVSMDGPSHSPHFVVEVQLPDGSTFTGEGRSKKEAEQSAASLALKTL